MAYITTDDLEPFATIDEAKAEAMIADAQAQAILAAPCLANEAALNEWQTAAVKAVLRGAILRWNDSGSGAYQQQVAGPFALSYDSRQTRRSLFWPSEIENLQEICLLVNGGDGGGAFAVDTVCGYRGVHADVCSLYFGALYCSCGADIAGFPLWESA